LFCSRYLFCLYSHEKRFVRFIWKKISFSLYPLINRYKYIKKKKKKTLTSLNTQKFDFASLSAFFSSINNVNSSEPLSLQHSFRERFSSVCSFLFFLFFNFQIFLSSCSVSHAWSKINNLINVELGFPFKLCPILWKWLIHLYHVRFLGNKTFIVIYIYRIRVSFYICNFMEIKLWLVR